MKVYRDSVVETVIGDTIAAQLLALRNKIGLSQTELAKLAKMAQPRIAVLENPDYDKYTVNTLKRLASALDVGLIIRFAPYGEVMDWVAGLSPEAINVPTFEEERKSADFSTRTIESEINLMAGEHPKAEGEGKFASASTETAPTISIQAVG